MNDHAYVEAPADAGAHRSFEREEPSLRDDILRLLAEAQLAPAELAERVGMSMEGLARWVGEAENARHIEHLAWLADVRAALLIARFRTTAAIKLIELASDKEHPETARKASTDLLTLQTGRRAPERPGAARDAEHRRRLLEMRDEEPPPRGPTPEAIMQRLGELNPDSQDADCSADVHLPPLPQDVDRITQPPVSVRGH